MITLVITKPETKGDFHTLKRGVWYNNQLSPLARLVLGTLVNSVGRKYISINVLAKEYGVSKRTIDRVVLELKTYHYLISEGEKENTIWTVCQE